MHLHFTAKQILTAGLATLFLLCGAMGYYFLSSDKGNLYAEVTVLGEKVMEIPLGPDDSYRIWDLQTEYGVPVHLETDHGRIRFTDVTCPDHICEKTGWLSVAYQSAVCMPNRTVVTIYQAN